MSKPPNIVFIEDKIKYKSEINISYILIKNYLKICKLNFVLITFWNY